MKNNIFFIFALFLGISIPLKAQGLLETLDKEYPKTIQYEQATFKATHLSIGQSVETRGKNVLQVMFMNRYWNTPDQTTQSFIADKWNARIGLEYGITDRFTAGGGWNTFEKIYDGYLKYSLFRQSKNVKNSLSATLFQRFSLIDKTSDLNGNGNLDDFNHRIGSTSQILIAHKFNSEFSAQVSPTYIYRNTVNNDPSHQFAVGFGGRYKVKPHVSLVSEYYYVANPLESKKTYGAFALGVNWDVRFLMLQFQMTNALSMVEDRFITQNIKNFNTNDGNFFFGFNAIFTIHTKDKKL